MSLRNCCGGGGGSLETMYHAAPRGLTRERAFCTIRGADRIEGSGHPVLYLKGKAW
jgi:hypothetical protein